MVELRKLLRLAQKKISELSVNGANMSPSAMTDAESVMKHAVRII
jgi:hypothetical protein